MIISIPQLVFLCINFILLGVGIYLCIEENTDKIIWKAITGVVLISVSIMMIILCICDYFDKKKVRTQSNQPNQTTIVIETEDPNIIVYTETVINMPKNLDPLPPI